MGTRAMITVDGKPFVATHWDGYPSQLGKDLMKVKTLKDAIITQALKRSIISADKSILEKANQMAINRIKKMPKRERVGYEWALKEGKFVGDIKDYGDFAEYQYDFDTKTGTWKVRKVQGEWTRKQPEEWEKLKTAVDKDVAETKAFWKRQQLAKVTA